MIKKQEIDSLLEAVKESLLPTDVKLVWGYFPKKQSIFKFGYQGCFGSFSPSDLSICLFLAEKKQHEEYVILSILLHELGHVGHSPPLSVEKEIEAWIQGWLLVKRENVTPKFKRTYAKIAGNMLKRNHCPVQRIKEVIKKIK